MIPLSDYSRNVLGDRSRNSAALAAPTYPARLAGCPMSGCPGTGAGSLDERGGFWVGYSISEIRAKAPFAVAPSLGVSNLSNLSDLRTSRFHDSAVFASDDKA